MPQFIQQNVLMEQTPKIRGMDVKWLKKISVVHLGSLVPPACLSTQRKDLFLKTGVSSSTSSFNTGYTDQKPVRCVVSAIAFNRIPAVGDHYSNSCNTAFSERITSVLNPADSQ